MHLKITSVLGPHGPISLVLWEPEDPITLAKAYWHRRNSLVNHWQNHHGCYQARHPGSYRCPPTLCNAMRQIFNNAENVLIVDASNAFNSLNCKAGLDNIHTLCLPLAVILTQWRI